MKRHHNLNNLTELRLVYIFTDLVDYPHGKEQGDTQVDTVVGNSISRSVGRFKTGTVSLD